MTSTLPLNEAQIAEIRQIYRLEALRSAVYSLAAENLDAHVSRLTVSCSLVDDELGAEISWADAQGMHISGGRL